MAFAVTVIFFSYMCLGFWYPSDDLLIFVINKNYVNFGDTVGGGLEGWGSWLKNERLVLGGPFP